MDQYDSKLGAGIWRTEYYVRRSSSRITSKPTIKTGGKPPVSSPPLHIIEESYLQTFSHSLNSPLGSDPLLFSDNG